MEDIKQKLKQRGLKKSILYFVLIIIMLSPLLVMHKKVIATLKGTCVVDSLDGLNKCQKEGRYTTIKANNFYDVGYDYVVDGKVVGRFLDVDMHGHSLIALVDIQTTEKLENGTGLREISGNLVTFKDPIITDTIEKVKQEYIERYEGTLTEEQTLSMFVPYQLDQYDGKGFPFILIIILIGIIVILLGFKLFEGLTTFLKPETKIFYGKKRVKDKTLVEKVNFELKNGPYLYQSNDFWITNNYAISTKNDVFVFNPINTIVWMYERGVKKYGVIETGKILVLKFKNNSTMTIKGNVRERNKIMEIVKVKNPDVVKGYDKMTHSKYNKDPESVK